eukprot:5384633-Alexandrium_andersonii.AAC.1
MAPTRSAPNGYISPTMATHRSQHAVRTPARGRMGAELANCYGPTAHERRIACPHSSEQPPN